MSGELAVDGGQPIRSIPLPYGRQWVEEDDITAVVEILRSDWLTTGPMVGQFEEAFAEACGAAEGVAVSSGTAALHAAMHALDIGPGDEVIVPPITFAATANAVLYVGAIPVFADVDAGTLLLDPARVERRITARTRAVIGVDYAGQPCDWSALRGITTPRNIALVADSCHALGGLDGGARVGTLADLTVFSLHPVKHITTGEGGMITTDQAGLAERMRLFRNHGISRDARDRGEASGWFYEMLELGYNYRLTDFQSALGLSQLQKVPEWVGRRREIAAAFDTALEEIDGFDPLRTRPGAVHAYHLYVVRTDAEMIDGGRDAAYAALQAEGIGVNVHYIPVYLHPFYRQRLGTEPGLCPVAEAAYNEILTLPLFPRMTDEDVADVIAALRKVSRGLSRLPLPDRSGPA